MLGVRTVVTFLFSFKTKTRGLSGEGDVRAAASDPSAAISVSLCDQANSCPSVIHFQYWKTGMDSINASIVMPFR